MSLPSLTHTSERNFLIASHESFQLPDDLNQHPNAESLSENQTGDLQATDSDEYEDIQPEKLFFTVKELIKNDYPIGFDQINNRIKLIKNEKLKSKCYLKIVKKILKTIEDFSEKLTSLESHTPFSHLSSENLHGIFDFLDEKALANLYLSNRYLKNWVNEYFIKFLNSFFYWVLEFCEIKNDYSIIGSIFDLINHNEHLKDQESSFNTNRSKNTFSLKYTVANLFKNIGHDFFQFEKFINEQIKNLPIEKRKFTSNKPIKNLPAEEKKFLKEMCGLINLSMCLNNLKKNHWNKTNNLKSEFVISNGNIQIFYQYEDLNFSENLRYLYFLLKHDPSFRHPLLIYFTLHFLIENHRVDKAKDLINFFQN